MRMCMLDYCGVVVPELRSEDWMKDVSRWTEVKNIGYTMSLDEPEITVGYHVAGQTRETIGYHVAGQTR